MTRIWSLFAASALALGVASTGATTSPRTLDATQGDQESSVRTSIQSGKAYHRASDNVQINVQFTNTGNAIVALPQWLFDADDVDRSFLKVTRDGAAVPYLAALVKRAAPMDDDVITLAPGESTSARYELSSAFDLTEGGVYQVSFAAPARHALMDRVQPSESISIGVEANPFRDLISTFDYTKAAGAGGISYTGRCTASEKSSLVSALTAAGSYADASVAYLNGSPSATPRYTTWFGAFSTANWNTVKSHYTNIKTVFDTKPIVFDCSCSKKNTYAYVYPSQPYKIYLCGAFWNAPMTGTDSKAGTLVHETSHFSVVAGTQDYAYGQTAAKSLALSNPAQAIMNADSHEYFAENTPAQP
jgi:peptidyl-Lys metalloendopeptidase